MMSQIVGTVCSDYIMEISMVLYVLAVYEMGNWPFWLIMFKIWSYLHVEKGLNLEIFLHLLSVSVIHVFR